MAAKVFDGMSCPKCSKPDIHGNVKFGTMREMGTRTGGFSGGKAVVGAVLAGPIGLAAGALGKKKTTFVCDQCGYTMEV